MSFLKKYFKRDAKITHSQGDGKLSYSQSGEDLIVDYLLEWSRISMPTYLDIGAHHPTWLSNTYYFYKKGCTGVCIEPDPTLYEYFKKIRRNDICLNVGVGTGHEDKADFYMMTLKTLNTFSRTEAENYMKYYDNCKIDKVVKLDLIPINAVIHKYFHPCPNFLSLDVEGLDFEVLKTLDLSSYRPEVICVETINYTADKSLIKATEIIDYMKSKEYFVYADTFINTIFVDRREWDRKNIAVLVNI